MRLYFVNLNGSLYWGRYEPFQVYRAHHLNWVFRSKPVRPGRVYQNGTSEFIAKQLGRQCWDVRYRFDLDEFHRGFLINRNNIVVVTPDEVWFPYRHDMARRNLMGCFRNRLIEWHDQPRFPMTKRPPMSAEDLAQVFA